MCEIRHKPILISVIPGIEMAQGTAAVDDTDWLIWCVMDKIPTPLSPLPTPPQGKRAGPANSNDIKLQTARSHDIMHITWSYQQDHM